MKSDIELQREVGAALAGIPNLNATNVSVTVAGGIVTLRGEVLRFDQRMRLEQTARRIAGVTAVINEIVATQEPVTPRMDSVLVREAVAALRALGSSADAVTVSLSQRVATLSGVVDRDATRAAAYEAVAAIPGIRSVVNLIVVAGEADAPAVTRRIAAAFAQEGMTRVDRIRIDVRDHLARLSGTLESVAERDVAVATAASTPGILEVDDQLLLE
jgi:osmotically-inducible protein OsmY